PDLLANIAVLPLPMDFIGVFHFGSHEIFKRRVAVKPRAILAKLGDPWPHPFCWSMNRDDTCGLRDGLRHELITRPYARSLAPSTAPLQISWTKKCRVANKSGCGPGQRCSGSFHIILQSFRT